MNREMEAENVALAKITYPPLNGIPVVPTGLYCDLMPHTTSTKSTALA